jgi:hypothetical protein
VAGHWQANTAAQCVSSTEIRMTKPAKVGRLRHRKIPEIFRAIYYKSEFYKDDLMF